LIALAVTRIRAPADHPGAPLFYLEGGPGRSNMSFAQAGRFAADRDVVPVGYRGVDGSVRLDRPAVESALERSTDVLGRTSFRGYGDALRGCYNTGRRYSYCGHHSPINYELQHTATLRLTGHSTTPCPSSGGKARPHWTGMLPQRLSAPTPTP